MNLFNCISDLIIFRAVNDISIIRLEFRLSIFVDCLLFELLTGALKENHKMLHYIFSLREKFIQHLRLRFNFNFLNYEIK